MSATGRGRAKPAGAAPRTPLLLILVLAVLGTAAASHAQTVQSASQPADPHDQSAAPPSLAESELPRGFAVAARVPNAAQAGGREDGRVASAAKFLLGGAAGLGLHEAGHVVFDEAFGAPPILKKVDFGGIPFFAISHRAGLPPREEFTITSAGFWMQHLTSEIVLVRRPNLRHERAPALKGLLAFNVLASVAYGGAAFAKAGPPERDTRAMADALRVDERWVGALVLAPAVLDAWRYFHPDSHWAVWLSRGVKVGSVLLVIR